MNQTSNIATTMEGSESDRPRPASEATERCTDTRQGIVQNVCSEEAGEEFDRPAKDRKLRLARGFAIASIIAILGCLFSFSLRLGATRIFQVDECVETYVARLIATGAAKTTPLGNFGLFELVLSRLVGSATRSIEALLSARLLMVELFWLNILLITLASGQKLLSFRGVFVLLGAATLAPLWDYGFEIRHDNPLLAGLLVTWGVARVSRAGARSFLVMGFLAAVLQFIAFKAFVYTIPMLLFALVFLQPAGVTPRYRLAMAWCLGAVAALGAVSLILGISGLWANYWAGSAATAGNATGSFRFGPGSTLERLLTQTPLLLAVAFAGLISAVQSIIPRQPSSRTRAEVRSRLLDLHATVSRSEVAPEAVMALIALTALLINPTPFPYNLVNFVPFIYLLAVRYGASFANTITSRGHLVVPIVGAVLFTHVVPFCLSARRHLDWPNWRQEALMRKAEDLTDPARDPVYDATGMVFTRPIVDVRAFIHSTNIKALVEGSGLHVRDMLAANPPAVYLPNYRTDALAPEDHDFVRHHYVSLADDFWVLGQVVEPGKTFDIIHPGRYRISTVGGSDIAGTYPDDVRAVLTPEEKGEIKATVDGNPLTNSVLRLAAGSHSIETEAGIKAAVVWVGPQAERVHRLANRDHRFLFVNWY